MIPLGRIDPASLAWIIANPLQAFASIASLVALVAFMSYIQRLATKDATE